MHRTYHGCGKKTVFGLVLIIGIILGFSNVACLEPLRFTLDAPPYRHQEAIEIAEQLKVIGVQTDVRIWEKAELRTTLKTGSRAASLTDWGSAFFDPFDLAGPKLSSGGRGNFSFYTNLEVDRLLAIAASSTDVVERKNAYFEIQEIISRQVPWSFGYTMANIEAMASTVLNYHSTMDSRVSLHDVKLKTGDRLVVGMNTSAFVTMDPAMYRDRETEAVIHNIYDGLVTRTAIGSVVPQLAEYWEFKSDAVCDFVLRQGPIFHNGDPVTVEDVIFTFNRILEPLAIGGKSSPRRNLLGPLRKVVRAGPRRIRFILEKPFPAFLQALVHFQIVPQKYVQQYGETILHHSPVGAGPFRFVSGELGKEVILNRFDEYYGGSPLLVPVEPPALKKVVFKPMPDPTTRVAALLANEVAIIQALPVDFVRELSKKRSVKITAIQGTRSYQMELNNERLPFNDIRVRKAMNYGIDWPKILKEIYKGHGHRLATCFLPSGFGHHTDLQPYPYDPEKARQLLKQAGYSSE